MATEQEGIDMMLKALQQWAERNASVVIETESGKYYGLFLEPDGEGPRMQFMGSTLARAYSFIRNHPGNRYQ